MFLLLGHATDSCCAGVAGRLEARGLEVRITDTPLASPARLEWRLDSAGLATSLMPGVPDREIKGALVRDVGWLDPAGWEPDDHAYMQAELRAVLLAWLAGLSCPVINAADASLWYRAGAPFIAWRSLLRRVGLPLPEALVTTERSEAAEFRRRLSKRGVAGAVYTPLTAAAGYLLADDEAWERVAVVQKRTPVCLTEPHGGSSLVCLVGDQVIWSSAPSPEALALESSLRRFAAAARLKFVELALAHVSSGLAVVMVDPRPRLEHFDDHARDSILDALVAELTKPSVIASNVSSVLT